MSTKKKPIKYKTIAAVIRAKQAGTLPRGFVIRIDNNNSFARAGEEIVFEFDGGTHLFVEAILAALGIKAEGV